MNPTIKQTIVIYFSKPKKLAPPLDVQSFYESYRLFSEFCAKRDTAIIFARGKSYIGDMTFTSAWHFIGNELCEINGPIRADLIYLKDRPSFPMDPNDLVVNDPELIEVACDKWKTYQLLHPFMSATYQIDVNNWREVVAKIATDKIVLKPLSGAGGKGIIIVDKNNFDISMLHTKTTYIAQDFVDSSQGIPGICEGYHDLRILMFNGRPTLSFVRTAKTGSLLSNVSQGASAAVLEITDIPQEILDIAHRVDSELLHYNHRFYSSDFFMSNGKPYLVEINSMPGFPQLDVEGLDFAEKFFDNLYDLLNNALMQSEK